MVKTYEVDFSRKYGLAQHFQDHSHSFSPYGPPSQQITYIYWQEKSTLLTNENKTLDESV